MPNPSLHDFIMDLKLNKPEDLLNIENEIELDYFPTALAFELQKCNRSPVIYLQNIKGFSIPLVSNIFSSYERILELLGCKDGDYSAVWNSIQTSRVKPVIVDTGPVKEVILKGDSLDLGKLPIPKHFINDAGKYISGAFQVARDPDSGISNLSYHRMQMKGSSKFGINLASRGHLWDYYRRSEERNKDLEVAVVIGAHPKLLLSAVAKVGIDLDEYEIAGALFGKPVELVKCETIDVYVPANAEIIIEGKILAHERDPEGPFGEYTGYSMASSTNNVFIATALTRKKSPIYVDNTGGNSADHLRLARAIKEMMVYHHLKEIFPELKEIYYPNSGVGFHCYLSMDIKQPGRVRQALMNLFSLDHLVKIGIIVNAKINVREEQEVLWAVATKVQAAENIFVVENSFCNIADPSSRGTLSDKIGIDATGFCREEQERVILDAEALKAVKRYVAEGERA